jgi:tripartite-type tricarboxylate transporter receptor subunit TctC
MTFITRRTTIAVAAGLLAAPALRAQTAWPNKDLRLVCPFPPGGTTDVVARLVAAAMREIIMAEDVQARLNKIGVVPWGLNVQESAAHIARESERWSAIVKRANLRPE